MRLRAPLTFEAGAGKTLAVPMLEAAFAGAKTRLIVDTGASDHVLTTAFVTRHGLPIEAGAETGKDHAGSKLDATPLRPTSLELAAGRLPFEGFVVAGPPPFEGLGIGGILSPQRLNGSGYVVLDIPRRELVVLEGDEPGARTWLSADGEATAIATTWSRNKPFVEVALASRPTVLGELDTGSSGTEATAAYAGEATGAVGCQGIGLSGACVEGATLEKQTVVFAGRSFAGRRVSIQNAIAHGDRLPNERMLLGIDVLGACVLAVPVDRTSRVLARCAGT